MSNIRFQILFVLAFLLLGGITIANAQVMPGEALRGDVSHPFVVRDKLFPAGEYRITPIEEGDGSTHLMKLQSENGKQFAVFDTMGKLLNEPSKKTELLFDRVGGEYILSGIRVEGEDQASQVIGIRSEKRDAIAAAVN